MEDEYENLPPSCNPMQPVSPGLDAQNQQPLAPVRGAPVPGNDIQPTYEDHSCANLNKAWTQAGSLPDIGDALLAIKKLPGIGEFKSAELIGCGIGQTIGGSPNDANMGLCNGADAAISVPFAPDPCPQR